MGGRQATGVVIAGFVLFSVWEGIKHIWLTGLTAAEHHMMSISMELGLALLITVAALRVADQQRRRRAQEQTSQETVVTLLEEDLRPSLRSLLQELREIEKSASQGMNEHVEVLAREAAHRVRELLVLFDGFIPGAEADRPGSAAPTLPQLEAVASYLGRGEDSDL